MNSQSVSMMSGAGYGTVRASDLSTTRVQQTAARGVSGSADHTQNQVTTSAGDGQSSAHIPGGRVPGQPGGFFSPVMRFDQTAGLAVLHYRDFESGETTDQIPAKSVVERYRQTVREAPTGSSATPHHATAHHLTVHHDRVHQNSTGHNTAVKSTAGHNITRHTPTVPATGGAGSVETVGYTPTAHPRQSFPSASPGSHLSLTI